MYVDTRGMGGGGGDFGVTQVFSQTSRGDVVYVPHGFFGLS